MHRILMEIPTKLTLEFLSTAVKLFVWSVRIKPLNMFDMKWTYDMYCAISVSADSRYARHRLKRVKPTQGLLSDTTRGNISTNYCLQFSSMSGVRDLTNFTSSGFSKILQIFFLLYVNRMKQKCASSVKSDTQFS